MIIRLVLSGTKRGLSLTALPRLAASRSHPSPLLGNTATILTIGGRKSSLPSRAPVFGKARLHLGGRLSSLKPCVISGEFADVASTARLYEWIVRNGVLSQ
jgi:hypothetical protein